MLEPLAPALLVVAIDLVVVVMALGFVGQDQRTKQAVLLVGGTGREEERVLRPGRCAVAESQRPKTLDWGQDARRRKKLIATGWDQPSSRELPGILREMESRPFDGVVVPVAGRRSDGKPASLGWAFVDEKWSREWFQPEVDGSRACKFQRLTDNFVIVGANPGNVDWFDDDGWRQIVEHWRIAAWVAKQVGRARGILFDPEPYTPPHAQFGYAAQPQAARAQLSTSTSAKARQRGPRGDAGRRRGVSRTSRSSATS